MYLTVPPTTLCFTMDATYPMHLATNHHSHPRYRYGEKGGEKEKTPKLCLLYVLKHYPQTPMFSAPLQPSGYDSTLLSIFLEEPAASAF